MNFIEKSITSNLLLETNPVYELDKKTLKYGISSDSVTSIDLPSEFGQTILVIDTADHVKNNYIFYGNILHSSNFLQDSNQILVSK